MTAYYDTIAEQYQHSKQLLKGLYIDVYTYLTLIGNLTGKSVLDLGCGEGYYTRLFKQKGATEVFGVDISPKMIELAQKEEQKHSLGIKYLVSDVTQMGKIGSFDLVVASYLLNHAQTKEQLLKMCRTIYENLKSGGRFVAINDNVQMSPEFYHICEKYGYSKSIYQPLEEGTPITLKFYLDGEQFTLDDYYLSEETYEWAFRTAGFREYHIHKPMVSPEGIEKCGQEYWQDFLDYAPMIAIECSKCRQ